MLVQVSFIPIGVGTSLSQYIAKVVKVIDESGIPYQIHAMGTIIEGEWDEIMNLIKKCKDILMGEIDRLVIDIKVDDRKGTKNRIEAKVKSVEEKIGKSLRK